MSNIEQESRQSSYVGGEQTELVLKVAVIGS
jgi:hypothetical protein